jgi:CheY-like chemotaxis protein
MHDSTARRIILVDPSDASRAVMARRLSAQGYLVEAFGDPAKGADVALASPPCALVADLWMPSISGVQRCRLLRAEPATAAVPVILRGQKDDPRSRFWAGRAGAAAYVAKGRMGELVRVLAGAGRGDTRARRRVFHAVERRQPGHSRKDRSTPGHGPFRLRHRGRGADAGNVWVVRQTLRRPLAVPVAGHELSLDGGADHRARPVCIFAAVEQAVDEGSGRSEGAVVRGGPAGRGWLPA